MVRQIKVDQYDSKGYTNETSLGKLLLTKPDKFNRGITYLYGSDTDKFPMTFMTEGQGTAGMKSLNDIQYTWDTQTTLKHTDRVVSYNPVLSPKPGLGHAMFKVVFASNWFIKQYGLVALDGSRVRIMYDPEPVAGGYEYTLQMKTTNSGNYIAASNFAKGTSWAMEAPTVPESLSRGNRSNVQGTGEMTNQISIHRFSKTIAGNLANKVVSLEFKTKSGGTTNLWIAEEMRQFELHMRQMSEEHIWFSEYNRDERGVIHMKDPEAGNNPVPEGAGVMEMIREANHDTYGVKLPLNKIRSAINDIFYQSHADSIMEIVLYAGKGFIQDFDEAIKTDITANGFLQALGEKSIHGDKGKLSYGAYFTQYRHISGHLVTIKPLDMFDHGARAEMQIDNNYLHPVTNYPMISHTGVFVDHSTYSGEKNVRMAYQKGQDNIIGIYKGMAPIPDSWGIPTNNQMISTDEDIAKYEKKYSRGINISNTSKCFMMNSVKS